MIAPRKTIDERIRRISSSGIQQQQSPPPDTTTDSPSRWALAPSWARILQAASTSVKRGQLCNTHSPGSSDAARIGRAAFFAPWTRSVPDSRLPPQIFSFSIFTHPFICGYAPLVPGAVSIVQTELQSCLILNHPMLCTKFWFRERFRASPHKISERG